MDKIDSKESSRLTSLFGHSHDTITSDESLQRFYEIESVPPVTVHSPDDILCEEILSHECIRLDSGLFKEKRNSFFVLLYFVIPQFYSMEKRIFRYLELGLVEVIIYSTSL